jgi:hypothetical protein
MGVRLATGGGDSRKTVTTAGTPVQLDAADAHTLSIQAETDNTGLIAVGFSNAVRAAEGSQRGRILNAGESVSFAVDNVSDVWIDSTVSGDGVALLWVK